jgi:hypothetical protein
MIKIYGAPIDEADVLKIVEYLAATYWEAARPPRKRSLFRARNQMLGIAAHPYIPFTQSRLGSDAWLYYDSRSPNRRFGKNPGT